MAHPYIMEQCLICGTCWDICPMDAVVEFKDYYQITDRCDDCGKCIRACPNFAIAKDETIGMRLEEHARAHVDSDD